jgi:hypothetical protein
MEESDPFNGAVMYLADIEKYDVVTTASSTTVHALPENVLSRRSRISYWESADRPNQFLVFDFGRFTINLMSYIIQSADNGTDERHPRSWMIVGSDDHENWDTVDAKEDIPQLNARSARSVFTIDEPTGKFYRYLKLIMTEANFRGDWTFRLSQIEFFGSIKQ